MSQYALLALDDHAIILLMLTPELWPTDPQQCHDLLSRFAQQVEDLRAALEEAAKLHDQTVQERDQLVEELRRQIELYRRYVFGPRRERITDAPGQGRLFDVVDVIEGVVLPPTPSVPEPKTLARPRQARKLDFDGLPQVRIEHDVSEADKVCDQCGAAKARISKDEARVLQFIPAWFELHVHVLPKYGCSYCRDSVVAPEPPQRPVSGCIAGAGILAEVVVSKFAEHLTLYRFEDISTRYGLYLPRSTLCDWIRYVADLVKPLYQLQRELV
jgi:transposase